MSQYSKSILKAGNGDSVKGRSAFTLIEVMLAVTILGLVVGAVYATWSAALSGWRRGTAVAEEFQRQRIVIEALSDLTQSAVFFTSRPELYEVTSATEYGLGDTVSFVTASDRLLPPKEAAFAGLRRITLGLRRDDRHVVYLGIANSPAVEAIDDNANSDLVWHRLSQDVIGFRIRYRNPRDGGWYERWEEPGLIPAALEYTVAFRNDDPKAPPLIVTRAVEFPTAQFALEARGQTMNQQNTTNTVERQDINLSESATETQEEGGREE